MAQRNDSKLARELSQRQSDYRKAKRETSKRFLGVCGRGISLASTSIHPEIARNLVGVGVAEKRAHGRRCNEPSITFFVKRKLPKGHLTRAMRLPKSIDGLTCDVVQTGIIRAADGPTLSPYSVRTLTPGCEIGVEGGGSGTLGGFVLDRSGDVCLMTNYHVVAPGGGDPIGQRVYHPAYGSPGAQHIATVTEVAPISSSDANVADVAIARLLDQDRDGHDSRIPVIGSITGTGRAPSFGTVAKYGSVSGYTSSTLDSPDFDVVVDCEFFRARFTEVMVINSTRFATDGDSGSFVVNDYDNTLVGLFIGYSRTRNYAIPIDSVEWVLPGLRYL